MEKPRTLLPARELLGLYVTILAHTYEDPESTFAQRPVLETLRNVLTSLDCCEVDMKFEPEASDLVDQ